MNGVEITQGIEYDPVTQVWKLNEEFWKSVRKEEVYTPKEEKYQDYYGLKIKVD